MAVFKPFKAFRPKPELAAEVAAKPYDVLNSEEARIEAEGHPYSFLHVGKPEIDLPSDIDIHSEPVYLKAKENLDKLLKEQVLIEDPKASFYLYAQTMDGRTQYGFVGVASVDDYWNDVIKKHEKTRKDKEEDRANHVRYTNSHSGPIFLTFHDNDELQTIINNVSSHKPNIDIIYDGVNAIDARIYFGKFCHDKKKGVLLSEIASMPKGKWYTKWLMTEFDKATDELIEACSEVFNS